MHTLLTGTFLKASDGTAAVDMQVDLVSPALRVGVDGMVSYQLGWGAGPVGSFKLQFSNVPRPGYDARWTDYPSDAYAGSATQPSGTASDTILRVQSMGEYCRAYWDATSGGTGVLPEGDVAYLEGRR